jgi:hypothetical protein
MNPKLEKGIKILNKGMYVLGAYIALIVTTNNITMLTSDNISSQQHLEKIVEKERMKLDNGKKYIIYPQLISKTWGEAKMISENEYKLIIGGSNSTEAAVRHELYHIFDGHCKLGENKIINSLEYWFVKEPKAAIYAATGIKL